MNWRPYPAVALMLASLMLTAVAGAAPAGGDEPRVKLISLGWDAPTTAELRRNLAEMEKRPFDGVILRVEAAGQPKDVPQHIFLSAHGRGTWERGWFSAALSDLKAVRSGRAGRPARLKTNFLTLNSNPGNVDWFDDAGWRDIVEHWRIGAWVARQGGLRGICFDPEPYAPPHSQFTYSAQPERKRHTFAEYRAKARQRGREVMRAVAAEFPDMLLLTLFMNSVNVHAARQTDPEAALATAPYGLYPAFIDGWLDAAPPGLTFVDGNESAYYYTTPAQFREAALEILSVANRLVSPENRRRYRAQVQVGSALYLDAHLPKGHPALPADYPFTLQAEGPRDTLLRRNAEAAAATVDEIIWVYGEQCYWWDKPSGGKNSVPWPEALPGVEQALLWAVRPVETLRKQMADTAARRVPSLLRNSAFTESANDAVRDWGFWHVDGSTGQPSWDAEMGDGSARIAGERDGCFIQELNVKPGERYGLSVRTRWKGSARPHVRIRWQTSDSRWIHEPLDVLAWPSSTKSVDGWNEIVCSPTVPDGAGKMSVLLYVGGQTGPEEIAWFDDVRLVRLSP